MLNTKNVPCTILAQYNKTAEELEFLKKKCKNLEIYIYQCDLSIESNVKHLINSIQERKFVISNILHLPAGLFEYKKIQKFSWDYVKTEMNIQLNSFVQVTKVFISQMLKKQYGKIVIMLSSCTLGAPPKYLSEYVTVKYALMGYMKALASEYAGKGICINGISPNMIETRFIKNIDSRMIEMIADNSSLKRNISIEEVINAIDFLMSDDSSCINGLNLNLSGGDFM